MRSAGKQRTAPAVPGCTRVGSNATARGGAMSRAPALAGICALFGCVWQFGDPPPEPDSVTVAPQGGVVSFPGGPALRIPAGALREATKVSIVQSAALRPS